DGKYLYAYGDDSLFFVQRKSPFDKVVLSDLGYEVNLEEVKSPDEKAILIATEPITRNENWKRIKGLKIFADGEEILLKKDREKI
ncbi:MAG: class II glutamine amidotransferase, partial [Candidatus Goldbacteria bacterium]|nr:class II glutamine amidotransferase [Candidatus Goldiibacteriota bacterium]